jgi:hypothetical protein
MERIKYLSTFNEFVVSNPEVIIQSVLPEEILDELYYYQRVWYKFNTK